MSKERSIVLKNVDAERDKQDAKWSKTTEERLEIMLQVLVEEVGEVARAMLEGDTGELYQECIQVAAVAVAMAEGALRIIRND